MPPHPRAPVALPLAAGRRIWMQAQRLTEPDPFGSGPDAAHAAVAHLGYVQIDTINVIERCHHHILFTRIPAYRPADLAAAQSVDRSVFEYWTHALSYVPTADWRFFIRAMRQDWRDRAWFGMVGAAELRRIIARIEREGPLTIRDIDDDALIEKDHAWASRKPSKRALQLAFYRGDLVVSARSGMLKTYELTDRHFGWETPPRAATEAQVTGYVLDRALRAQGLVSLDSICHLDAGRKAAVRALIEARTQRGALVPVTIEGAARQEHWATPEALASAPPAPECLVHILSPFDPLAIQRRRLSLFFGHDHRFEAYVPREKRVFGYFALPVLVGDRIVAAIDMKTDRAARRLCIQQWSWLPGADPGRDRPAIEAALDRFERFQLCA